MALDAHRCLSQLAPGARTVVAAGGGGEDPLWRAILGAVGDVAVERRASSEAAGVGACLLAAAAVGAPFTLGSVNPVLAVDRPDPALVETYRSLRPRADRVATFLAGLEDG